MCGPSDALSGCPWLAAKEVAALAAVGITTAGGLLDHFPKRHEDRRRFDDFPRQASPEPATLRGLVTDTGTRNAGPARRFHEAVVSDREGGIFGSGAITCRWFNMPFIGKLIAVGQEVCVYGKVKESGGRLVMDHPEFEVLRDDEARSIHVERIVPIYRNIPGLAQRRLREILHEALQQIDGDRLAPFPDGDANRLEALRAVHFPEQPEAVEAARRRFALEEYFGIQLEVLWRKSRYGERSGRILGRNTELLKRFHEALPFELTNAQKRSIREIAADMREPRPMHRLLQGDVGAGKTFVAMAAMLLAVGSGCQAVLMAPTQILAEQHFLTFRRWLEPLGVRVALRTGSREESSHLEMEGAPQIVIGTHALLYGSDHGGDLGLVVIDEQHKFGVAQRAALIRQGRTPDVLVMTATPIPRTLTMTVYGDLEVSLLDEKPAGRGRVVTAVRTSPKQADVTRFVKDHLAAGRQVYLVYPLVEESEALAAESATGAFDKWRKRLRGHEVGLLHGKLRPEEKEAVMRRFRDGEIGALVATTVIEVGVDVPNATLMILHHAERFGLAQLHQLRGRIGRGGHKGYCILLTDGRNPAAGEKLRVLESSADGFEIAEADLRLRGPGDVLGQAQSGISNLRFPEFLHDLGLLKQARALAEQVLREDPDLSGRHVRLRTRIPEPVGRDQPPVI